MKYVLLISFLTFSLSAFAPSDGSTYLAKSTYSENPNILKAFMKVESNFDCDTINRLGYGGILQIGQEAVDDANRILVLNGFEACFTLNYRLDSLQSVRVWWVLQNHYNPSYDVMKAAKIWNPLASKNYLTKILKEI